MISFSSAAKSCASMEEIFNIVTYSSNLVRRLWHTYVASILKTQASFILTFHALRAFFCVIQKDKKVDKYSNLSEFYHFVPVGVETYGAYGPQGLKLVKQIGKKIQDATGEKLSTFYLFQSISMAIQKGNAQCVTGCVKDRSSGLEGLFNFHVQEADELW